MKTKTETFLILIFVYMATTLVHLGLDRFEWWIQIVANVGLGLIIVCLWLYLAKITGTKIPDKSMGALRYFISRVRAMDGVMDIYSDHYDSADFITVTLKKQDDVVKQKIVEIENEIINKFKRRVFDVGFKYVEWN